MLTIFVRTVILYLVLSITMKLMGKRQLGELEVGELIVTLLVSEIAALPIGDADVPLLAALVPIIFLTSAEIALASAKGRSRTLKRMLEGEPIFLIKKGELISNAFKKSRVTVTELLSEMRAQGIWDINQVYYAMLEGNGKFSFIRKEDKDGLRHALVVDGRLDSRLAEEIGYGADRLKSELLRRSCPIEGVLLATVDESGNIYIIIKEEKA